MGYECTSIFFHTLFNAFSLIIEIVNGFVLCVVLMATIWEDAEETLPISAKRRQAIVHIYHCPYPLLGLREAQCKLHIEAIWFTTNSPPTLLLTIQVERAHWTMCYWLQSKPSKCVQNMGGEGEGGKGEGQRELGSTRFNWCRYSQTCEHQSICPHSSIWLNKMCTYIFASMCILGSWFLGPHGAVILSCRPQED